MTRLPLLFMCLFLWLTPSWASMDNLLPTPKKIERVAAGQPLRLVGKLTCSEPVSERLARAIENLMGQSLTQYEGFPKLTVNVTGQTVPGARDYELAGFPDESYHLSVGETAIAIEAATETGVIRALQTLAQMAEDGDVLEACDVTDWPAFKLRGWMHDVGRSFISVEELKRQIRLLGRFKVNTFHWHLTENQAWRFEVKKYPQLTSAASMTRFVGQYYTQEECREVVSLAADYGIKVIPEIDMPGHSQAFQRAMGHSMQTDQGMEELKNILSEVADVFADAPYIHIGADEQAITYPNFLKIITDQLHELGKRVVVWNPISGVTITTQTGADMTQMWSTAGKKISGMPNIDCRYNYVNHFDVFADLVGIYKSNVYYEQQGSKEVAGEITAVWNDRYVETEEGIMRQNNVYANVLAASERAWKGGGRQYIEVGGTTLPNSGEEFEEFADWERRFLFHKAHSLKEAPIPYVRQSNVRWLVACNGDTVPARGAGVYLRHTWGTIVPSLFANPQLGMKAQAWTYVYSPKAQEAGALVEFQNYGRSEKDKAPENGKWDRKGSRLWVNDEEIPGPTWTNAGRSIDNEVPLGNENFTARKPVRIQLREGWNKVLMDLPYASADGVRLNKWMFTFVLTDVEGRDALDGLIYSPKKYLDEEAEELSTLIDEARHSIAERLGTEPGYLPASLADELNAILSDVEPTLDQTLSPEQRQEQRKRLQTAYDTFLEVCNSTSDRILPQSSDERYTYWYTISTPLRDNRYVQSNGGGAGVTGGTSPTATRAMWKFVERNDGTFDIVNRSDASYISPSSSNNTQVRTVATSPTKGWTLKAAATLGYLIVTSGSVQLNQTNPGLNYQVYNWGSGTNTTDTGCQFAIRQADFSDGIDDVGDRQRTTDYPLSVYDLSGRRVDIPKTGIYIKDGRKVIKKQ